VSARDLSHANRHPKRAKRRSLEGFDRPDLPQPVVPRTARCRTGRSARGTPPGACRTSRFGWPTIRICRLPWHPQGSGYPRSRGRVRAWRGQSVGHRTQSQHVPRVDRRHLGHAALVHKCAVRRVAVHHEPRTSEQQESCVGPRDGRVVYAHVRGRRTAKADKRRRRPRQHQRRHRNAPAWYRTLKPPAPRSGLPRSLHRAVNKVLDDGRQRALILRQQGRVQPRQKRVVRQATVADGLAQDAHHAVSFRVCDASRDHRDGGALHPWRVGPSTLTPPDPEEALHTAQCSHLASVIAARVSASGSRSARQRALFCRGDYVVGGEAGSTSQHFSHPAVEPVSPSYLPALCPSLPMLPSPLP